MCKLGLAVFMAKVPKRMASPKLQLNTVIKCCQLEQGIKGATIFSTPIRVQENKSTAGRGDRVKLRRQFTISIMLIHNAMLVADPNASRQLLSLEELLCSLVNAEKFVTMIHSTHIHAAAVKEFEAISQYLLKLFDTIILCWG